MVYYDLSDPFHALGCAKAGAAKFLDEMAHYTGLWSKIEGAMVC
jgi:hypothetical protein